MGEILPFVLESLAPEAVTAVSVDFGTNALLSELGANGLGSLGGLSGGAQTMSGLPSLMQQVGAATPEVASQINAVNQAAQTANLGQQMAQFGQTGVPQAFNPAVENFAAQASPYTVGAESITNTLPQVGEGPTWEELAKEYEAGNNIAQTTTQANSPLLEKVAPLDAGPAVPQLNPINPVTAPSGLNPVEAAKALDTQTYDSLLQQNMVGQGINKPPPGILDQLGAKYNSLSGLQKLGVNIGGSMLAQSLLSKKPTLATQEKYSGPLSKYKFVPGGGGYNPAPPTPYTPQYTDYRNYAAGGLADLGGYSDGGRMLKGPGDGMSDSIPATINQKQPARLANEEFVIPADVVSHLGNGSSDAGAKQLYKMMDKVRAARTGTKKQGKEINPDKYLPA
jgi:hypothetical protein